MARTQKETLQSVRRAVVQAAFADYRKNPTHENLRKWIDLLSASIAMNRQPKTDKKM